MKSFHYTLIFGCFLLGCSDSTPKHTLTRAERNAARIEKSEKFLKTPPASRTYQMTGGELRVFEIPTKDKAGFLELQHCFVWRDTEFKTSSINCPSAVNEAILPNSN
jgi:hypothetical protein